MGTVKDKTKAKSKSGAKWWTGWYFHLQSYIISIIPAPNWILFLFSTHSLTRSPILPSRTSSISLLFPPSIQCYSSHHPFQHFTTLLFTYPLIQSLNALVGLCQILLSNFQMCSLGVSAVSLVQRTCRLTSWNSCMTSFPPDGCQRFHPPPMVDKLLTRTLLQTPEHENRPHTRSSCEVRGLLG